MTRARDLSNLIGSGNYSSTTFTATAGQTAFTISHTQGFVQVFMNGLLLDETVDYTSNGTAITLTSGAAAGDEIEVVAYNTFSVGDALNQAAADTRYVNATGDTISGELKVNGNVGIDTGTITPRDSGASTLQIGGNGNRAAIKMHTSSSGIGGTDGLFLGYDSGPHFYMLNSEANGDIKVGTSNQVDRLIIDASGRVTKPQQPYFLAKPTASGDGITRSPYKFENVIHNIGNGFVTSGTGAHERFVAPVTGNYYFATQAGYLQGGTSFGTRLGINNSHYAELSRFIQGSAGSHCGFSGSIIVRLSANDFVSLFPQYTPYHLNTNTNYFCGMLMG